MKQVPSYGDPVRYLTRLHVAEDCLDLDYTREIISRANLPVTVVGERGTPTLAGAYPGNLGVGKRHLFLCRNRGAFFKPCPATRVYRCCEYQVLNIGMNCPMDCVYCILQAYLNNPWLSFFVNIQDLFAELDQALDREPDRFFRIGTGEFTDSLALDSLTHLSPRLVRYMAGRGNAILELKSKSVSIDNLQGLDHQGRTLIAWSLNTPEIMAGEEIRTATLEERLQAAVRCAEWGYRLAFHFDPIILHPGWQEGYRSTIRRLFATVPAEAIAWISLGALRYLPALKSIATERFPATRMFYQEFIDGLDGKRRYFRTERVAMYQYIVKELRLFADPRTCIYFCMENDTIWEQVFGFSPEEQGGLPTMLDRAVQTMT
ncbi:SPL family radical SAM protein [Desulfobulbus alkaliphilus]|uniref:SPL family radical SAM protein n=1 Tax=Desulfobulbus alkaliphilus TaxID=869814 RepID=UPI001966A04C|nr:DNA photolyase [Desulfobulbus alkaliphilus]MBM9538235.1 DNA photolyase [Desulfobulbus alkaliphilus]